MAMVRCKCGTTFDLEDAQDAKCPNCGKRASLSKGAEIADFLEGLEKGEVNISSRTKPAEKTSAKEAPAFKTSAASPAKRKRRTREAAQHTKVVHIRFKKVAFWPVLVMAIAMYIVAAISLKDIATAQVPFTADGYRLEGERVIDATGTDIGPGKITTKIEDGVESEWLVQVIDGQEWEVGKIVAGQRRPVEVFAILGAVLGTCLLIAAIFFRQHIKKAKTSG